MEIEKPQASRLPAAGKAALAVAVAALIAASLALAACGSKAFAIEGTWRNTGSGTYAMVQSGTVVTFDGQRCNVMSPSDTYAFSGSGGSYRLDVSAALGGNQTFDVKVSDNDHITLSAGSTVLELTRVS